MWQGICYTIIGIFSKLICGVFVILSHTLTNWRRKKMRMPQVFKRKAPSRTGASETPSSSTATFPPSTGLKTSSPSLLPVSALLGSAMVARGEISLLILNLAREASPRLMPDDLFYIAIWATLLCTIVGPLTVGIIVKRMQRHEKSLPVEWGPVAKRKSAAPSIISESSLQVNSTETGTTADTPVQVKRSSNEVASSFTPTNTVTSPPLAHRLWSIHRAQVIHEASGSLDSA